MKWLRLGLVLLAACRGNSSGPTPQQYFIAQMAGTNVCIFDVEWAIWDDSPGYGQRVSAVHTKVLRPGQADTLRFSVGDTPTLSLKGFMGLINPDSAAYIAGYFPVDYIARPVVVGQSIIFSDRYPCR